MTEKHDFSDCDILIKAKLARSDIHLLVKYVEGLGHLGVVTTTDRMQGEVMLQTTKYCWPDLQILLTKLPLEITFLDNES